jgi:hypothetical protein
MTKKPEKICRYIICAIAFIFSVILFFYAMESSFTNWSEVDNDYIELLFPRTGDNILFNVLTLIAFLAVFALIYRYNAIHGMYDLSGIQKTIIFVIVFIAACIWIYTVKIIPIGDENFVLQAAKQAALDNDWSSFETGGYMSKYYQQIGLFTVMYGLTKLHPDGWIIYQVLNCAALSGTVIIGYSIAKQLWKNEVSGIAYIILHLLCLPALVLTTFIYGELISVFFIFLLIYETQHICTCKSGIVNIFIVLISSFMALWIRKNAMIVLLAVIICLFIQLFINSDRRKYVLYCLAAVLFSMFLYHAESDIVIRSHIEKTDTIPASTWIVMGLEKNSLGYGAYNAYNILTFEKNGFNADSTNKEACERIKEIFRYYSENPKEALMFFKEKILWQWTDPSFGSFLFTGHFSNDKIIWDIYYGRLRKPVTDIMNLYQNVIYLGMLAGTIICIKKNLSGVRLIIPVSFIGYFLFSAVWEAKPRYMVMCFIIIIPFAAGGIGYICSKLNALYNVTVSKYRDRIIKRLHFKE